MTELCRLCGDFKLTSSHSLNIDDEIVKLKLENHLKINLDPDKLLPSSVCSNCIETLDKCVQFKMRIMEVQERLKNELLEQLIVDEFPNFELKIERLDFSEEKSPKIVKKKISNCTKRNRGIKMTRQVVKYTMNDLFSNELSGKFTSQVENLPVSERDKNFDGKLSENYLSSISHTGWFNYEWKCRGCCENFQNVIELERHSIKCIKKRCVNHCNACIKDFPSYSTYINHITEKHQSILKFSCIICSEFRWNFVDLYRHILSTHSEAQSIFFCLYCGKNYFTGALLRDHLIIHQPEVILPEFTCDICAFKTVKKQILLSHMSRFHLERRFTCECCAFSFKYRAELIQHQQSQHNDECNEECKICGKKFKNKRKLRRHMRNMHESDGVTFNCEQCGKISKNKKSHVTHMKIHSDKDIYQCPYCPRSFKHSSGFTYHLRTHTGERPYMCPICEQKYIDWPNCKKHIKSSHGDFDLKPIQIAVKN